MSVEFGATEYDRRPTTVPAGPTAERSARETDPCEAPARFSRPVPARRRVLVVDDSAVTRKTVRAALMDSGWSVDVAENGEEGAMLALNSLPDAVVSDLWMPGLSGLQLCRLLHEEPATRAIPIVLMSATADRRSRYWARRSGARAFLEKARAGELPAVLEGLSSPEATRAPFVQTGTPTSAASIPGRLSVLLDRVLFDTVVAAEVRGLALGRADVASVFEGLAGLLIQMVSYRWLALVLDNAPGRVLFVHAHPDDRAASGAAALRLGVRPRPTTREVLADGCSYPSRGAETVLVRDVTHGAEPLGQLAMCLAEHARAGDDVRTFELAARECALPLQLTTLLESTRRRASTDDLTSLPNRRALAEQLESAAALHRRHGLDLSVAMIDIDHFKRVNDTHGHHVGDEVLRTVAAALRRAVRKDDFVGRWGGEEFLALLPLTAGPGARAAAERLRAAVASVQVPLPSGEVLGVSVSLGVATLAPTDARVETLVARADQALYRSKAGGRNRVEMSEPPG